MKIAVIGAGIFGAEISLKLALDGHEVHLFEKNSEILLGATSGSQNRLHMGLHYPRDLATAIQSRNGYFNFSNRFGNAVRSNFPSYYGVSSTDSKVSVKEFEEFAKSANISLQEVDKKDMCIPINNDLVDKIYRVEEGVIDIDRLRVIVSSELTNSNVTLNLNSEVISITRNTKNQYLVKSEEATDAFPVVIRATYGVDQILFDENSRNFEYQQTLILSIEAEIESFGFTIMDGDFLTLLPQGFTSNFLIYAPSISTLSSVVGTKPPAQWFSKGDEDQKVSEAAERLIARTRQYFPEIGEINVLQKIRTIRSIDPKGRSTDQRVSKVIESSKGFFEVWSGKIDHSVDVADEICSRVANYSVHD